MRGEVGCGKVKRRKPPVEDLVIEALMYRLDSDDLSRHIDSAIGESTALAKLLQERELQKTRLTEILNLYSTGELEFPEFKIAKTIAAERTRRLSKQIDATWSQSTLANIPHGKTVQDAWESSDLSWKRQLVDTVIDKIFIDPKVPGKIVPMYKEWRFDSELVRINWKI
ncbi:hypothetical protein [Arthrobacter sp. H14-L1]|uniref:hypothetical protein n=1 Tax=Arthrobacter sp. H14-L1 TaxID=2996697 RepID=UPI002270E1CB|nr:hypothetical protein [Arthrobacter sp. H14-L1]MCY0906731.1 hypothetical protein [Arthrobacter sp. H14-L1]